LAQHIAHLTAVVGLVIEHMGQDQAQRRSKQRTLQVAVGWVSRDPFFVHASQNPIYAIVLGGADALRRLGLSPDAPMAPFPPAPAFA